MLKLFIDEKLVDLAPSTPIAISLGIAHINKIDSGRTSYSKLIQVPITSSNRLIFGDANEIHALQTFNQQPHSARIEVDGSTVLDGTPMISRCERTDNKAGWYLINIIGAGKTWVQSLSDKMFNATPIPFSTTLSAQSVAESWTGDQSVRFLPVQRDRLNSDSERLSGGVRQLTFTDYHPFLNIRALLDAMMTDAGYTIASTFMDSAFFRSLYLSGRYPEKDVTLLHERMGCVAGRYADATATADRFGRVYADPFTTLYSIGNIVDTADSTPNSDGTIVEGTLNNNGCFKSDAGQILYQPIESIAVGFEYRLSYRSDYRILNRTELACFNRLILDDELERVYKVNNRHVDRRDSYHSEWEYRLIVFDHTAGNSYRLTHELSGTTVTVSDFTTRTTLISTASGTIAQPKLWILSNGSYVLYDKDWALYDSYITETGQIDIEVTARSMPRVVTHAAPRYFHRITFGGADQGMHLTLLRTSTLRTIFMPHPCEGSSIEFADVAAHKVRQIALFNALKHLFNLYFYTDTSTHTVYIEPRDTFYRNDVTLDWSSLIDRSRPITIEELGADLSHTLQFEYQSGDGYVSRWNRSQSDTLGRWSTTIDNLFADEAVQTFTNPLFTASLNSTGAYADAPSASLLQVGDRDSAEPTEVGECLNFPPKIVCFEGIETLSDGLWGWPNYNNHYPRIAFHDPQSTTPFTLCFEDRDALDGLHTYYDSLIDLYNHGRRITLYLQLRPEEVEPILHPNGLCHDLRARFKLTIDGETLWCRLEEICDYNPSSGQSTKCVFLKS